MTLSIRKLSIECHYAECRTLFIVMPNVIVLSVVMLSVIVLSVVMLTVVMLTVALLSVVAPFFLSVAANCILHLLGVFFGQVLSEASALKLLQS